MNLAALADYCLALPVGSDAGQWEDWRITQIAGGMNNLVFRATHCADPHADLAIKFTIRDARDRAGREYATLTFLEQLGLNAAPRAVYLNRYENELHRSPVVIQTWLEGQAANAEQLPSEDWQRLIDHLQIIHSATPELANQKQITLPRVVLTMRNAHEGMEAVRWQVRQLPAENQPQALCELMRQLETINWPSWPEPAMCLCRGDNNIRNFIKPLPHSQDGQWHWRSVDWEYSGWGDPAFEIADLMSMPSYLAFDEAHWAWLLAQYLEALPQREQSDFAQRVQVYRRLMAVWWVARLARMIYEQPRQKDQRLVPFDLGALDEYRERLGVYVERGWRVLAE